MSTADREKWRTAEDERCGHLICWRSASPDRAAVDLRGTADAFANTAGPIMLLLCLHQCDSAPPVLLNCLLPVMFVTISYTVFCFVLSPCFRDYSCFL